jgi:GTP cyclohydrolase I
MSVPQPLEGLPMSEDQQASSSFEVALDGDADAARARGNSLSAASAFLEEAEADFMWDRLLPREITPEDWKRYEGYVAEIFTALGMDLNTPGTHRTPERFLRALYESTSGYEGDPNLLTAFPTECRGGPDCRLSQVIEGPINFFALCEHHSLPFFGVAHVGYVPHESIIGISKLTRLVRVFARRFTVQERLGVEIADTLVKVLEPHGVAVHLSATHLCTQMRGVKEESSKTWTSFWRGSYEHEPAMRQEFLQTLRFSRR